MPKTKKKPQKQYFMFTFRKRHIRLLLDKVLFFRFIRTLHGRFWGVAGMLIMLTGFTFCFIIRPDMIHMSTAFSNFGADVRTAPYFAGSVFFGAYGMWRWRNYLSRSWKRTKPVIGLVTLTIIGLYLIALMPVSWKPIPYKIHMFGVMLAGFSMLITVVLDGVLTKTKKSPHANAWRFIRFVSIILIVSGGWLTYGSSALVKWYDVSLLGETMLLGGYFMWICLKTYQGEGNRTNVSKLLKDFVLID